MQTEDDDTRRVNFWNGDLEAHLQHYEEARATALGVREGVCKALLQP